MARGMGPRERGALLVGRAAGQVVRRLGRGGGTALPGLIAGRLAPGLVETAAAELGKGSVIVTGTNGKTTTGAPARRTVAHRRLEPMANPTGSNLERGIAAALVDAPARRQLRRPTGASASSRSTRPLPRVRRGCAHAQSCSLNLFRDQLDRYGEVDSVAEAWRALVADAGAPHARAQRRRPVGRAARRGRERAVITFGIEDAGVGLPQAEHASDARLCRCGASFEYAAVLHRPRRRMALPAVRAPPVAPRGGAAGVRLGPERRFDLVAPAGGTVPMELPFVGLYSVYNALAAAAAAYRARHARRRRRALCGSDARLRPAGALVVEGARCGCCSRRTPPGSTRCVRALDVGRAAAARALRCSTTASRTVATFVDLRRGRRGARGPRRTSSYPARARTIWRCARTSRASTRPGRPRHERARSQRVAGHARGRAPRGGRDLHRDARGARAPRAQRAARTTGRPSADESVERSAWSPSTPT